MSRQIIKEYENELKITVSSGGEIISSSFSPYINKLRFRFQASYKLDRDVDYYSPLFYAFKLALVKLNNNVVDGFASNLEASVSVKVYNSDGSLFHAYKNLPSVNLTTTKVISLEDLSGDHKFFVSNLSNKTLTINCRMTFFGGCQASSPIDFGSDTKSLNKYQYLKRIFKAIYESPVSSDFVFKIGENSFPAHKVILAAHSPVLKKMMTHEFLESKNNSVTITDATPEIFDMFLKYLYSCEIENTSFDTIKELYYMADKYDVEYLKNECTTRMISFMSVDKICEILQISYKYSDPVLKKAAIKFAFQHIKKIVSREDWKELVTTNSMIGYEVLFNYVPK